MNLNTIGIIIRREYLNKVKKKSFLIITFLSPVLFAALCTLPALIMSRAKEDARKIAVVDRSGIVMPVLEDCETIDYVDYGDFEADSVKAHLSDLGYDAVLYVSEIDSAAKSVAAVIYSEKPLGLDMTQNINNRVNSAVEAYRVASYDIAELSSIMEEVKADVKLVSYTVDADGKESISESGVFMLVSMLLGMVIYMFIAIFGGSVMSSVIEEKSSRVVEVIISSVKATELMFGKIIGIALVAVTQFVLWILLTGAIVGVIATLAGPEVLGNAETAEMMSMGATQPGMPSAAEITEAASGSEGDVIFSTLTTMPWGRIIVSFLLFFLFGYMLYASMFAAIGSAVENEGDSQQLQIPLTIPLLIGFFIAIYAYKAPDSALVVWGSMIPFTSPIVMLARLPFNPPVWQLILSIALLVATFAACAWVSAKIYKVGILMFGKKSTWKDLWLWFKQK